MAQVVRRLPMVRRYGSSNPEPIKSRILANVSQPLQPWFVSPGIKLWRWALLTRETRKDIKRA